MTERPIIFSAPMVNAILAGRKSQTRRVLKPQPPTEEAFPGSSFGLDRAIADRVKLYSQNDYDRLPKHPTKWELTGSVGVARDAGFPKTYDARHAVGDRLWVREAWAPVNDDGDRWIDYRATPRLPGSVKRAAGWDNAPDDPEALRWRSPIHMPRWASRLTLTVTDVRVQRLQDISAADAIDEGFSDRSIRAFLPAAYGLPDWPDEWCGLPGDAYRRLWDRLHGPGSWDANPWVTATSFTAERRNIDGGGDAL